VSGPSAPSTRSTRLVVGGVAALAVLAVAGIALAPYSWRLNRITVHLYVFFRTDVPIAPSWVTPEDYGNLLNVLLFVPIGLLLAWWLGSRWAWALPVAAALSVSIELVQRVPAVARESSLADVACNVTGACVGVVLVAVGRVVRRRSPAPPAGSPGALERPEAGGPNGRQ
jgi:VanZ like family